MDDSILQSFLALFGDHPLVRASVMVGISLLAAIAVDLVTGRVIKMWARRSSTDLDDRLIDYLHRPLFLTVLVIGFHLALAQLDLGPQPAKYLGRILKTLLILTWLVFAARASSIVLDLLSRLERRFTAIQPSTVSLFDQVLKIALTAGAIYFLFLVWGVNVGAWLAGAGIVGIAVGLAAKDTLANVFAGIFILADAPYQVGDFVVLDSGDRGVVTQIGLRSTRLLTRDDIEITMPNSVIANAKILNESAGRWEKERVRAKVSVAYGSDLDEVERILLEVACSHPEVDDDPEPRVRFRSFGDSGLELELMGWIHQPVLRGRILHELNSSIYKRLRAAEIEIPYPKRDVYLYRQPDLDRGAS